MPNAKIYDCPNCGQAQLSQTPSGTLQCPNCGSEYAAPPASVVDNILQRVELQKLDRFTQRAEGVADLKAKEEADSKLRLQKMWDEEHQRQAQLAAQLAERQRQEMQLMRITLAILAITGLALLIILIATAMK